MKLTTEEKKTLLTLARHSIKSAVTGRSEPLHSTLTDTIKTKCGAFVTLHLGGELRGCIGYVEALYPLVQTVEDVAAKAAIEDPRFFPVREQEIGGLEIEISVMSPLELVNNVAKIEIGRDGLMIDAGFRRGLLLPQVATDYGWDREEFLQQTCHKAGLPSDAWKRPNVKIYRFSVELFSEKEFAER